MTELRDKFALKSLKLFAHPATLQAMYAEAHKGQIEPPVFIAQQAYGLADALLKIREGK